MKLIRWLIMMVLLAAVAAVVVGWNNVARLRAENDELRAEIHNSQQQSAAAAEAASAQHEQELQRLRADSQEVVRLRNEITQLRSGAKETDKLRTENQQLRGENQQLRASATAPAAATPAPSTTGDQFPKASWAFAGYATPEAALVSAVWAMKEGKPQTYLDSLSPEEQARMAKAWENKSETEIAAKHQQDVASITGVRILERQTVSPNEVTMTIYVEGAGRVETVSMKRLGNDWKFGGFIRNAAK